MSEATTPAVKATIPYDASAALVFGTQAKRWLTTAREYVIDSPDLATMAGADLQQIKALQQQVEATRRTITDPLFKAKQAVDALFKSPAQYLEQAESTLKKAILRWDNQQRAIAEAARRLAEQEAAAERARIATEEQRQREAAAAAEAESRRLAEAAAAAAAAGDAEKAAAMNALATQAADQAQGAQAAAESLEHERAVVTVQPATIAPAPVVGISSRTTYSATVTDLMALVQAIAAGRAPLEAIQANTVFLGQQARAFKRAGLLYPGVDCIAERGLAARAA